MTSTKPALVSPICSTVPNGDNDGDLTSATSPMPGHLSAQALADLALPGLPSTRYRITQLAARENWRFIERTGRGGGRLFATADLPDVARAVLLVSRLTIAAQVAPRGRPAGRDWFADSPDIIAAIEFMLTQQRLSAPQLLKMLAHDFPRLPSLRTLQRRVARLEAERSALIASVRNPDLYNSKHRLALGRADASVTFANEIWELDTTPADALTIGGRDAILGLIDRYSRRGNFMVADSESGQSVRRLLVETIRRWGVMPAAVMTDNGSGYINASIKSALAALGIEHIICPPGKPQCKPHIERFFGTFTRQHAELLDGYIGHNVAEAQQLRARARKETGRAKVIPVMTREDLQAALTNWLDGDYHHRVHSSLRMTPMQKWLASPTRSFAAPSKDVLRLALSALVGPRHVGKRGVVWQGGRYWSPALAAWMDRDVIVRRDEDDLGALFIFAPDGHFIDIAVDHERSGLSEQEFATEARRAQERWMAEQRADLKARAGSFNPTVARDAILRRNAEVAGKLAYLPPRTVPASTPTIDSLTEATTSGFAAMRENAAPDTNVIAMPVPASSEQRVRDADALFARAEAGEQVDAAALASARRYAATSDYRSWKALSDHFASGQQQA